MDFTNNIYKARDKKYFSNIIIFCVGTDKITGDSLGPLVGYKLKKRFEYYKQIQVIGDLDNIICAKNAIANMEKLKRNQKFSCIIVIDAALSEKDNVGNILVNTHKIQLGAGLYKNAGCVGDVGIKGIVAKNDNMLNDNYNNLKNTRLQVVMNMADIISDGIYHVLK